MKRKDYIICEAEIENPEGIPTWPVWREINEWLAINSGCKKEIVKRDDKNLYVDFLFPTVEDELAFKLKFGWQS